MEELVKSEDELLVADIRRMIRTNNPEEEVEEDIQKQLNEYQENIDLKNHKHAEKN
jgi:hypothetical protein